MRLFAMFLLAAPLFVAGECPAALLGRIPATPEGTDYQAYHDTASDTTWLADANYAFTSGYPVSLYGEGSMTWNWAQLWVGTLNTANHLGANDWRLPTTLVPDASCNSWNYNCTGSEMGSLYYTTLGNVAGSGGFTNSGPFTNVQAAYYWSGTESDRNLNSNAAWRFNFDYGIQDDIINYANHFAWAVRDGDIEAAGSVGSLVAGDYNMDGITDAADYTLWQDNLDLDSSVLNGNGSGASTVVQADYLLWKTHFGESVASGSEADLIPEPTTLLLALLGLVSVPLRRRHR